MGKSSFAFAWVLDETAEERERGITVDVATSQFESNKFSITILDTPGHRDFVSNMISGASQADLSILVIDSSPSEFESGFSENGQTREHALLIKSLGIERVIIAVNKLDMTKWSQERFNFVVGLVRNFLLEIGFVLDKLIFIPCSGLEGTNLISLPKNNHELLKWYKGYCLVDALDSCPEPERLLDLPLRLPISDVFKGGVKVGASSGVTISGKIIQGHIQSGQIIKVFPSNECAKVKVIQINEESVKFAVAGDLVLITLIDIDILQIKPGSVICHVNNQIPVSNRLKVQISILDVPLPILAGFNFTFHYQSFSEQAKVTSLIALLNKLTGAIVKNNPRHITKLSSCILEIQLERDIYIETLNSCKELSRIVFRKSGRTMATGLVLEILPTST